MNSAPVPSRTRSTLRCALLAALLPLAAASQAGAASDPALPGEVLVRLRSSAGLGPLLIKHQLSLAGQFGSRPIYRLRVAGLADSKDVVAALLAEPGVLSAEPNFVHRSPEARKNRAWAIGTRDAYTAQWAPTALRLGEAHQLTTGAGMRVAVLDTGVDRQHAALSSRLLPGFDFVDFDLDPSESGSPADIAFGHGTHVAGLVALVAPGAKIMPLRVLDPEGRGNAWVLAEALLYALDPDANAGTDDGAHVINLSLGSYSRTRVLDSVALLATCTMPAVVLEPEDDFSDPGYNADKDRCGRFGGAVVVVAVGNDASDRVRQYPAAEGVYGLLAVAASNAASKLASFSNFGSWVDVAAPGEGLTSPVPGGGYGTWSGTSMAAPLAAGAAALVRALNPGMTPRDVARRLVQASAKLCDTKLRQVDAAAALLNQAAVDKPCR